MDIKLSLNSDFHQYYDAWFDQDLNQCGRWKQFDRLSNSDEISRYRMFLNFYEWKLNTPEFGFIGYDLSFNEHKFVVYSDAYSHAGEEKILANRFAAESMLGKLYSKYIKSSPFSSSYRYLKIGNKEFYLYYCSDDDWRSNCGNVTINLLDKMWAKNKFPFMGNVPQNIWPMLAIDFVEEWETGKFYAIDFNCAPGIDGTPIEDMYSGKEIVNLLKEWYN
jgi:hypothetical protein